MCKIGGILLIFNAKNKRNLVKNGIIQSEDFVDIFSFDEKIEKSYIFFCEKLKIT